MPLMEQCAAIFTACFFERLILIKSMGSTILCCEISLLATCSILIAIHPGYKLNLLKNPFATQTDLSVPLSFQKTDFPDLQKSYKRRHQCQTFSYQHFVSVKVIKQCRGLTSVLLIGQCPFQKSLNVTGMCLLSAVTGDSAFLKMLLTVCICLFVWHGTGFSPFAESHHWAVKRTCLGKRLPIFPRLHLNVKQFDCRAKPPGRQNKGIHTDMHAHKK